MNKNNNKKICQIYLSGNISATLVIPIKLARKYDLDKPTYVTIEEHPEGILIRKLNIK